MPLDPPDWLVRTRAGVIILLVISVLIVLVVFALYLRAWFATRRAGSTRPGLAPKHVAVVSISTLGLQATLAWGLSEGLSGIPPTADSTLWRTVLYGLCSVGIIAANLIIGSQHASRRVRFRRRSRVVVDRGEQVEVDPE